MERLARLWNRLLWTACFCMGFYIVFTGGQRFWSGDLAGLLADGKAAVQRICQREFARCLYPGLFFAYEEDREADSLADWYIQRVMELHPLYRLRCIAEQPGGVENEATGELLADGGVRTAQEEAGDGTEKTDTQKEAAQDMESLVQEENQRAAQEQKAAEEEERRRAQEEAAAAQAAQEQAAIPAGTIYSMEELSDFDFLFSSFYTMEANTTISPEDLNAETLLAKDMTIDKDTDGPQILIYHTHSQEGFVDSVPGDLSTTIVGVGAYLTELLTERGYEVLHVTSVYDLVDGKLDRNEAYAKAEKEISGILAEHPSIQSVIDLHRDGVREGTHLVTEIGGKPTAKFMFFNGLSRTKKNGPIDYLYNPYIQDNLALTLQLKLMCEQYYPGLSRNIYLKGLRYNLHLSEKALLIEVGAQTNTLQEMLNTMEPLADVLDRVFSP